MPELPEVETYRRYFNRHALRKTIRAVNITDSKNFPGMAASDIERRLMGGQFVATARRGKYLIAYLEASTSQIADPFLGRRSKFGVGRDPVGKPEIESLELHAWELDHEPNDLVESKACIAIHFGMNGYLCFTKSDRRVPAHSRTAFLFQDGSLLHYINPRRFGGIWWVAELEKFDRVKNLGPDALSGINSSRLLQRILGRSGQAIKQGLMNQKLLAGIGNLYADEILFQSSIHPCRRPASLKPEEWDKVFDKMKSILRQAVQLGSKMERYPATFLLPHRWGDRKCPRCRAALRTLSQGQRTAYYCPFCQRRRRRPFHNDDNVV
ncbi:MAG: hypothetical protein HY644_05480 [Acidobacteria bacterium]|nr:hypothetical protein [Acidobacteriota bacterium]